MTLNQTCAQGYFKAYAIGIVCASICTDLDDDAATERLNQVAGPTGLDHGWMISTDQTFRTGEPNPCPCPDGQGRRHILFNC